MAKGRGCPEIGCTETYAHCYSYRLDFSGGSDRLILHNAIVFSLLAWVFALFVKAIKISHGFGTEKSIGVLALAIGAAYALVVVRGTINATVLS